MDAFKVAQGLKWLNPAGILSSYIALQQMMEGKMYFFCQYYKKQPNDWPWLPNESKWHASLVLLFIIFDGIRVFGGESGCHLATWWNGGAAPTTTAFVSHLNTPGSILKSNYPTVMTAFMIVGQQLLQFDQSLILANLTPIKPTFSAHVPPH